MPFEMRTRCMRCASLCYSRIRSTLRFNTQATEGRVVDASKVLKEAWEAVQGANLPEEVHGLAFREAVRLLSPPPTTVAGPAAPIRPIGGSGQAPKSDSARNGSGSTKDG